MKRKFLSIALCLMLCFSSMLIFGACKEKPVKIGEVEAANELSTAMANLVSENSIKIYSDNFLFMGQFTLIATEDMAYTKMDLFASESWTKKEGDNWYVYSVANISETETPNLQYIKQLVPTSENESLDETFDLLDMLNEATFSSGSKLKGEITISYSTVEDGVATKLTCKIADGKLKSFTVGSGFLSMTINFEFGDHLCAQIPAVPSGAGIVWDETDPFIDVEDMPTTFEIGDSLNLEDVVLEFYEDAGQFDCEEFAVTMDMITGFSTEEAGTYTMTITFCGLTFDVEYTVSEPVVSE